jgi:hypothetical protein
MQEYFPESDKTFNLQHDQVIDELSGYYVRFRSFKQVPRDQLSAWKKRLSTYWINLFNLDYQPLVHSQGGAALPAWLQGKISNQQLELEGTPTQAEQGTYVIQIRNKEDSYILKEMKIQVVNPSPPNPNREKHANKLLSRLLYKHLGAYCHNRFLRESYQLPTQSAVVGTPYTCEFMVKQTGTLQDKQVIHEDSGHDVRLKMYKQVPHKQFSRFKRSWVDHMIQNFNLDYQEVAKSNERFPIPNWMHYSFSHNRIELFGTPGDDEQGTYLVQLLNRAGYIVKAFKLNIVNPALDYIEELSSVCSSSSLSRRSISSDVELSRRSRAYAAVPSFLGAEGVILESSPTLSQRSRGKRVRATAPATIYGRSASSNEGMDPALLSASQEA